MPQGYNEQRRAKKDTCVTKSVCVRVCEKVQDPLTQRASVCCGSKLSITLDSQGLFRTAVNRSPTLPVGGLEARDAPTTEIHPVSLDQPQKATAAASQEDPVCQSGSNHPMTSNRSRAEPQSDSQNGREQVNATKRESSPDPSIIR